MQEEAKEAQGDLEKNERLAIRRRGQKNGGRVSCRPCPARRRANPSRPPAPGAAKAEERLSQKGTFGPIQWQLSKLQENATKLVALED